MKGGENNGGKDACGTKRTGANERKGKGERRKYNFGGGYGAIVMLDKEIRDTLGALLRL
jgi:hypothetical protein